MKDMYNPKTNTLDIRSNGLYSSNVLSNLCSNGFRFDGMICGSMEGFPQSLKRKELDNYDRRDKTQELIEKSVTRKKLLYQHGFGSSAASGTAYKECMQMITVCND